MAIFVCFGVGKIRRKRLSNGNEGVCEDGYDDNESMSKKSCNVGGMIIGVRKFNWEEMDSATLNYLDSRVIGYGGFSTVYLATFSDSSLGAIKVYSSSSERLSRIYKQELDILLQMKHDHIVKLLGYCDNKECGGGGGVSGEEVARLVEEQRKLRDEKMEAEKECEKGSPTVKERDRKKEAERKRQERKKDKERASSKSNSDTEESEKITGKDNERHRKSDNERREHPRTGSENVKGHGTGVGHGHKVAVDSNHHRGNVNNVNFIPLLIYQSFAYITCKDHDVLDP